GQPGPRRPVMLAIAGDSAAGKTTLARGIAETLGADRATARSVDDYHRYDRAQRRDVPFIRRWRRLAGRNRWPDRSGAWPQPVGGRNRLRSRPLMSARRSPAASLARVRSSLAVSAATSASMAGHCAAGTTTTPSRSTI